MKLISILTTGFITIFMASCSLVKDFTYTVNPNPAEMHGDSVRLSISVMVPEKGIQKKVKAEISPKIGNTTFGTWTIQGEKVTGNGRTVLFKPAGTTTFEMVVPYSDDMAVADITISGKVFKGLKEKKSLPVIKIADGTIITPFMVKKEFRMIYEDDNYLFEENKTQNVTINFDRGQSLVKDSELNNKKMKDFTNWLSTVQANPKITITSINITGYASPDGVENRNQSLSQQRTESVRSTFITIMKKAKIKSHSDSSNYVLDPKGEDFIGFQDQLSKTNSILQNEKDLIIRTIQMNTDLDKREEAIKNLGKTWVELEKDVFPKIRRAEIQVNYIEKGLTDDEITQALQNDTVILGIEHLLYAGKNLANDLNQKVKIYELATSNFSSDFRAHNNLGAVLFNQNRMSDAKTSFEKANSIKDNASSKNNLAGVALLNGNKAQAIKLMEQTKSVSAKNSSLLSYNNAILNIMSGNYSKAESNLNEDSFNKALALILQGKLPQATKVLNAIPTTPESFYLKAIVAARSGESVDAVVTNLKQAFAKDSNLKTKASKDREFLKFMNDAIFTAAVN
jgi:outer membrane protein OmpA-like peptidoglycan-associated protein/tetratricopeptide (TPR) repeat protein